MEVAQSARNGGLDDLSFPPQIAQKAMEAARRENRTRSELVREALRRYMAATEWEQAQAKVSLRAKEVGILSSADVENAVDELRE